MASTTSPHVFLPQHRHMHFFHNMLVGREGVSPKLASILRNFLGVAGRYLCFTSHRFELEKVIGSRTLFTDTLKKAPDKVPSPRGVICCPVPRLQLSLANKVERLSLWKDNSAEKIIRTLTGGRTNRLVSGSTRSGFGGSCSFNPRRQQILDK